MTMNFETLKYELDNGVARVTLNRPEVLNAFNRRMLDELRSLWLALRETKDVRCIVLTGAGEKAFCTGVDRAEFLSDANRLDGLSNKFHVEELGRSLGPKTNDLWIPVVAAVNGIACGGAFYLLGEADIVIASDNATFFDPHVTTGLTPAYESIHMLQKMPFHEIMRIALMGSYERMSARRAYEIGFVTEITAPETLLDRASWIAGVIASQPALGVQGGVRALWTAREMNRSQALGIASLLTGIGNDKDNAAEGQARFTSGKKIEWRLR